MPVTDNLRPGVYSRYDVTAYYAAPRAAKYAAVVAKASGGEAETLYRFAGFAEAQQVFAPDGEGEHMLGCLRILFSAGVAEVAAVAVGTSYADAIALVEDLDNIGAVICDASREADLSALRQSVESASGAMRERIAYCGVNSADEAAAIARALNSERVVLACPATAPAGGGEKSAVYTACAVAGAVLAEDDCACNYNGYILGTVREPERLPEAKVQSLLAAGVSVVEDANGATELISALTTRSGSGDVADRTFRSLNTTLMIDHVMTSVRDALKLRLRGVRISGQSLESVRSQVMVVLAAEQDDGVLESFAAPNVYSDAADPSVCVVELSFKVAHVLSQIHVTAHIQI